MVSYEGEVKVIDFGLAKSAARSKHTLPSTVMGKLGYMSPEQVRGEALDHRTDLYALGVVLWELLAGRTLVPHGTMGEMMAAMINPKIPSLSQLRPDDLRPARGDRAQGARGRPSASATPAPRSSPARSTSSSSARARRSAPRSSARS